MFEDAQSNGPVSGQIVVVDDDREMQELVKRFLLPKGHVVVTFSSAADALEKFRSGLQADLILTDFEMPGVDGMTFVRTLRQQGFDIPVAIMTAFGSIESAVTAMKEGVADYVPKPFTPEALRLLVHKLLTENRFERIRPAGPALSSIGDMIGRSPKMQSVFQMIRRVSKSTANVLIMGESGTGKEMVARAIHSEGPRAPKPFVALNCAAIPENLLESELFGHAKGSFTGAINHKRGLLEEANGGTFFLDEIGDMNVSLQAKLLRVLQDRQIKPVGQNTFKEIDVRIIAATHKDLTASIAKGHFREDLYYRLSVIPINLPALRERPEDIALFADHFLKRFSKANHSSVRGFSREAMEKLMSMRWEGNVRQLENIIERAVILCDEPMIGVHHIYQLVPKHALPVEEPRPAEQEPAPLSIKEMEKRCLEAALEQARGKKERAAKILGISRKTLYRKERQYGLTY